MVCSKTTKPANIVPFSKFTIPKIRVSYPPLILARKIAPDEIIGGIRLWIEENYRRFKITVGRSAEGRRSFDLFGDPGHGVIQIEFYCPDRDFPLSYHGDQRPLRYVTLRVGCWAEYLEIEQFTIEYDNPEFFDELTTIFDWVLDGYMISDLIENPLAILWFNCQFNIGPFSVLEETSSLRQLLALPLGVPVIRCRGPPQCQAEPWHDV